jgi:F-type H+-transporting ATPase subunit delta
MNESRISVRYSRALFQSALEKKVINRIYEDMVVVREVCKIPEVKELLTNPVIRPARKSAALHKIFENDLHKLTLSFIDLVVRNGRESYLPAIARVFVHDTLIHNGITESILTTAVKVDPGVRKKVTDLITKLFKTKVDLRENVDDKILGGFILRVGDAYIDASVRNRLRKIRKELKAVSI